MINQKIDFTHIATIGEAMFYGHTFGLYYYNFEKRHQEEIYYIKLAKMMKDINKLRLAGKCYKMALRHSVMNDLQSSWYQEFESTTKPERIYRLVVRFYTDLGSFNHLKELKKFYSNLQLYNLNTLEFYRIEKRYKKECSLNERLDKLLDV